MKRKGPLIAEWLLSRFGVLERNESLIGDLEEERAAGRSVWWLWGQTCAAIYDHIVDDLRGHWLLALRAIAVGWVVWLGWGRMMTALDQHHIWHSHQRLWDVLTAMTVSAVPAMAGWIVARTHRTHQAAMAVAYSGSMAVYAAWYLTAHYWQIKRSCFQCIDDPWTTNLIMSGVIVLIALLGGLFPQPPSKRTAPRRPTP